MQQSEITQANIPSETELPINESTNTEKAQQKSRPRMFWIFSLIFCLLVIPLVVFLVSRTQSTPKPTTPSVAFTTLSLVLLPSTLTQKVVSLSIDTGKNLATGVQAEIIYDPALISNVTTTPGNFFTSPVVLIHKIDPNSGVLDYALAAPPLGKGKSGTGSVATITFTLKPHAAPVSTTITLSPQSLVTQEGIAVSVLKETKNITLTL